MVNSQNSEDIRFRVIRIIHDYLPLTNRQSHSFIEDNSDQELLKFFEISPDSCHQLIEELESEFSIGPSLQISINEVEKFSDFLVSKLSRFWPFKFMVRNNLYYLEVPSDVTVDTLCEVAMSGVWPFEFYKRT